MLARSISVCRPPPASTAAPPERPPTEWNRGSARVVVPWLEVAAQLDLSGKTGNDAMDLVEGVRRCLWVVVVVVSSGHEVGNGDDARAGGESCQKDVGVGEVLLTSLEDGAGGSDPEVPPNLRVQDGSEDAGRVEAREATPVHGAVGSDKCRGRHVAYQSVVIQIVLGFRRPLIRGGELTTVARRHTTRQEARIAPSGRSREAAPQRNGFSGIDLMTDAAHNPHQCYPTGASP